jgi:hypothetical protein
MQSISDVLINLDVVITSFGQDLVALIDALLDPLSEFWTYDSVD